MTTLEEKKDIKILMYADSNGDRVGQTSPYMEFMSQFGEVILVHHQNDLEFFISIGDVLVVPGGLDVNPVRNRQKPSFENTRVNAGYEYLDEMLLAPWLKTKKPTIGICRGAQAINTALNGKLYQNIRGHVQDKNRETPTQDMYTDIAGFNIVPINSFHHQAVSVLGDGLVLLGWSNTYKNCPSIATTEARKTALGKHVYEVDKVIKNKYNKTTTEWFATVEAFESAKTAEHNVLCFQYHPEELNCDFAIMKIEELLSSVTKPTAKHVEKV